MKRKSNGLVIVLTISIVVCLACGMLGLYENLKPKTLPGKEEKKEYKAEYRYYLDGEEVDEMIEQEYIEDQNTEFEGATTKKEAYSFEKYTCTNNVTGEWNNEEWKFTPDLTANTTCRLYFIKNMHEVTVKANNGKLPNNTNEQKINAELNIETKINVMPNNGYKFDKVECTNGATAIYDENTKDLKLNNVKKDSVCTVYFKINDYTVEVRASNGKVNEEGNEKGKTANYGGSVTFNVTPAENYSFDSVSCTNNQKANYADGKLTVTGITENSVCTIQFKPIKHSVSLTVEGGTLLAGYESPQSVTDGQKATFGVGVSDGYSGTGAEITCGEGIRAEFQAGVVYIYDVRSDLTCTLKLKKTETKPETEPETE